MMLIHHRKNTGAGRLGCWLTGKTADAYARMTVDWRAVVNLDSCIVRVLYGDDFIKHIVAGWNVGVGTLESLKWQCWLRQIATATI